MGGRPRHDIVRKSLRVLRNLSHRGATGSDPSTGDGAGILLLPHRLLRKECAPLGIELPGPGEYGAGLCFLPKDARLRQECMQAVEVIVAEEGQRLPGRRPAQRPARRPAPEVAGGGCSIHPGQLQRCSEVAGGRCLISPG